MARPMATVMNTATMMRAERNASHKMMRTMMTVAIRLGSAPSAMVANSSSAIGTGPVRRTRAPSSLSFRSVTLWRIASLAVLPGSSAA